jgi:hypothetical protein
MMADTVAMAEALEGLTVTRWEAWAGLLVELSLETNRKLLSLRVGQAHGPGLVLKVHVVLLWSVKRRSLLSALKG